MKPFFSIVTCTLNSERYVLRNIESVKSQTFKDYEHVFIDGYSKDTTLNFIREYKTKNPNKVKLFFKKPNGISGAMNDGIKRSSGQYLIFLHSDDSLYDSEVLKKAHNFLLKNDFPDWIYGKISVIEEIGKKIGIFPNQKIFQTSNKFLLKIMNFVPHQSVFIKKEILDKLGEYDESVTSCMDYDLWLRIAGKTRWLFFDRIVSNYTVREDAQSSGKKNASMNNKNENKIAKRHLNTLEYCLHSLVRIPLGFYNTTLR